MAFGPSGKRVVIMAKIASFRPAEGQPGITEYLVQWQLSERVADSLVNAIMTDSAIGIFTDIEPTDSEILSDLRIKLIAAITGETSPADPFLETDVRGGSL